MFAQNKKRLKKWAAIVFVVLFVFFATILLCDYAVDKFAKQYVYSSVADLPYNKVGLLLGTSKNATFGGVNYYFEYRIEAAEQLFKTKKIQYLIISGDNSTDNYNEPRDMKIELVNRGIADSLIILDYAGFRTFDSMVRCKEVFGQDSVTVISQAFHNERAVFIAHKNGLYAVGYNAKDVGQYGGLKTKLREVFARVKVVLDVYILNQKPKFLGSKVEVG
ncbi:MAG: ElyC/SanA/YdcF family protein [Bacteroidota bacterium]